MADDAILSAQTEAGEVYDDPSEDLLFELMSDLDGDDRVMTVVRLDQGHGDHVFRVTLRAPSDDSAVTEP